MLADTEPAPLAQDEPSDWYLQLLDRRAEPCWLVTGQGQVTLANRSAVQAMEAPVVGGRLWDLMDSEDSRQLVQATLQRSGAHAVLQVTMRDVARRAVTGKLHVGRAAFSPYGQQHVVWFEAAGTLPGLSLARAEPLLAKVVAPEPRPGALVAPAAPAAPDHAAFRHLSHELRTPLSAVLGFAELLRRSLADGSEVARPRHLEHLGRIVDAARHMLAITEDLLDPQAMADAAITSELEEVGVAELFDASRALTQDQFQQQRVALAITPPERQLRLMGDKRRCKQVLCNLLSNAVKYGASGGLVVLSARASAGWVRIDVRDRGPGLDAAQQARLFRDRDRLGAEDGPVEGHGMGLFISHQLVTAMGGRIGCDSIPGAGADFWFELPCPTND